MKKVLIGLVLSIVFLLAAVYLFIPRKIKIEAAVPLNAALPGVFRTLINDSNWKKWWPGETPFVYNKQTYSINGRFFNVFGIDIYSDKDTINSRMELVLVKENTMTIMWNAEQASSNDPLKRFDRYRHAKQTENNMNAILQSLKTFLQKKENIYGFDIKETLVKDSALISTRRQFDHYPGAQEVDSMIQSLRKYISQNNAIEKNLPMLNVFELGNSRYEAMTAIPVDKVLPKTNEFAPKFLLKGGNILEAQIQGGPYTIKKGLEELENYRADYKFDSPAIPYQLLVTDRTKEADTTKWITRLYYPVF
ncbi:MAG TPA: hypothetical protein VGQ04_03390 [Chitinophagaceae bacterium]|jgi:hypothetical protein|nr:hypothetical protein [Chitinophagaceae bacterium]